MPETSVSAKKIIESQDAKERELLKSMFNHSFSYAMFYMGKDENYWLACGFAICENELNPNPRCTYKIINLIESLSI